MGIGNDTFAQIQGSNDPDTLGRIFQFTQTGDQDSSNEQARALIQQRLDQIKQQQMQMQNISEMGNIAQNYRSTLPQQAEQIYEPQAGAARQQLAARMTGIDTNANKRGLLYSGLKENAQNQAAGQYAGQLSQAHTGANAQAEQTAEALEKRSVAAALQQQKGAQNNYNSQYDLEKQRRQSDQQANNSIFGAVGGVAGGILGGLV